MSIPPAFDQNEWDVRHYSFSSQKFKQNATDQMVEDQHFIESMLDTIENAAIAATDGWQLARIMVQKDEQGRPGLDVWLKRQKSSVNKYPSTSPSSYCAA